MGRKKGSGKKIECLECDHCKTIVFEDVDTLLSWCGRKSIKPNKVWLKEIQYLGRVRLLWCTQQHGNSGRGLSPRNAAPRHTADINKILEKEKSEVFISNQDKKTFICGTWDTCPFRSI